MKKWIFSLSLLLCSSLSNSHVAIHESEHAHDHSIAPKTLKTSDARFIQPYTVNAGYLSVKGMDVQGFDAASMEKMDHAFAALEKVVNSEEFKGKVLNFVNSQGKNQFASNKGLTNEQIYTQFMEGRETLQSNTPGEMNSVSYTHLRAHET